MGPSRSGTLRIRTVPNPSETSGVFGTIRGLPRLISCPPPPRPSPGSGDRQNYPRENGMAKFDTSSQLSLPIVVHRATMSEPVRSGESHASNPTIGVPWPSTSPSRKPHGGSATRPPRSDDGSRRSGSRASRARPRIPPGRCPWIPSNNSCATAPVPDVPERRAQAAMGEHCPNY